MPLSVATIGLVSGGSNAWKISFDKAESQITIGYGTMFYNGKYFTTKDLLSGTVSDDLTDNIISGIGEPTYIYLVIYNPLSLPTEETEELKIKIDILSDSTVPVDKNIRAPLVEFIPLAYIDSTGKVFDLRPSFWVNNFSLLA